MVMDWGHDLTYIKKKHVHRYLNIWQYVRIKLEENFHINFLKTIRKMGKIRMINKWLFPFLFEFQFSVILNSQSEKNFKDLEVCSIAVCFPFYFLLIIAHQYPYPLQCPQDTLAAHWPFHLPPWLPRNGPRSLPLAIFKSLWASALLMGLHTQTLTSPTAVPFGSSNWILAVWQTYHLHFLTC